MEWYSGWRSSGVVQWVEEWWCGTVGGGVVDWYSEWRSSGVVQWMEE